MYHVIRVASNANGKAQMKPTPRQIQPKLPSNHLPPQQFLLHFCKKIAVLCSTRAAGVLPNHKSLLKVRRTTVYVNVIYKFLNHARIKSDTICAFACIQSFLAWAQQTRLAIDLVRRATWRQFASQVRNHQKRMVVENS